MSKKHFRSASLVITLIIIAFAFMMMNSNEYKTSTELGYDVDDDLVGRADWGYNAGDNSADDEYELVDIGVLDPRTAQTKPEQPKKPTEVFVDDLVTLSTDDTYIINGHEFTSDIQITGIFKGSGSHVAFFPQRRPITKNVLVSTVRVLKENKLEEIFIPSKAILSRDKKVLTALSSKTQTAVPNNVFEVKEGFNMLMPGNDYIDPVTENSFRVSIPTRGMLSQVNGQRVLIQSNDGGSSATLYTLTDAGLEEKPNKYVEALKNKPYLQELLKKPLSIDDPAIVLVEEAIKHDRDIDLAKVEIARKDYVPSQAKVPYDYGTLFNTIALVALETKQSIISQEPVTLPTSGIELGYSPTGKKVYKQGGRTCVESSPNECIPIPYGSEIVIMDLDTSDSDDPAISYGLYDSSGEETSEAKRIDQDSLITKFQTRSKQNIEFRASDNALDVVMINGVFAIKTTLESNGYPVIVTSDPNNPDQEVLLVYNEGSGYTYPLTGKFESNGNIVVTDDRGTPKYYRPVGTNLDQIHGERTVVRDSFGDIKIMDHNGIISSFQGGAVTSTDAFGNERREVYNGGNLQYYLVEVDQNEYGVEGDKKVFRKVEIDRSSGKVVEKLSPDKIRLFDIDGNPLTDAKVTIKNTVSPITYVFDGEGKTKTLSEYNKGLTATVAAETISTTTVPSTKSFKAEGGTAIVSGTYGNVLTIKVGTETYPYDIVKTDSNTAYCYNKKQFCYDKAGIRVDINTGEPIPGKDPSQVIGKTIKFIEEPTILEKTALATSDFGSSILQQTIAEREIGGVINEISALESGVTSADDSALDNALLYLVPASSYKSSEDRIKDYQTKWIEEHCIGKVCYDNKVLKTKKIDCIGSVSGNDCIANGQAGDLTKEAMVTELEKVKVTVGYAELHAGSQPIKVEPKILSREDSVGVKEYYIQPTTGESALVIPVSTYNNQLKRMMDKTINPSASLSQKDVALMYESVVSYGNTPDSTKNMVCGDFSCTLNGNVFTVDTVAGKKVIRIFEDAVDNSLDFSDSNPLEDFEDTYVKGSGNYEDSAVISYTMDSNFMTGFTHNQNGVTVQYDPLKGIRTISDSETTLELKGIGENKRWIGELDIGGVDQQIVLDDDGRLWSVGGKSCDQYPDLCGDVKKNYIDSIIAVMQDDNLHKKVDTESLKMGSKISAELRKDVLPAMLSSKPQGEYIRTFVDDKGRTKYQFRDTNGEMKNIPQKYYEAMKPGISGLSEKEVALFYGKMLEDLGGRGIDSKGIVCQYRTCHVHLNNDMDEHVYEFSEANDKGEVELSIYYEGKGEVDQYKKGEPKNLESFDKVKRIKFDNNGAVKLITVEEGKGDKRITFMYSPNAPNQRVIKFKGSSFVERPGYKGTFEGSIRIDDKPVFVILDENGGIVRVATTVDDELRPIYVPCEDTDSCGDVQTHLKLLRSKMENKLLTSMGNTAKEDIIAMTERSATLEAAKVEYEQASKVKVETLAEKAAAEAKAKAIESWEPKKEMTIGKNKYETTNIPGVVVSNLGGYFTTDGYQVKIDGTTVVGYCKDSGCKTILKTKEGAKKSSNFAAFEEMKAKEELASYTTMLAPPVSPSLPTPGTEVPISTTPTTSWVDLAPSISGSKIKFGDGDEVEYEVSADAGSFSDSGDSFAYVASFTKDGTTIYVDDEGSAVGFKDADGSAKSYKHTNNKGEPGPEGKKVEKVVAVLKEEAGKKTKVDEKKADEKKKAEEEAAAKKKAEDEAAAKKAEEKKKAEAAKAKQTNDIKLSENVAGLDSNGDLAVCAENTEECDAKKASFMFRYDDLFSGTEGYVYVKEATEGKEKGKKVQCSSAEASTNPDCKAVNCGDLKGCKHVSDGNTFCTTYQEQKACATSPKDTIVNIIENCDKNGYKGDGCAGAQKRMDALYDSLNFEFRSKVESVFGTLLDDMTGNFFNKMEYWMYESMCQMDYYNTGESNVDVIAGAQITQEDNYGFDFRGLKQGEVIATVGGEREMVDEGIYRYSFSLQTVGALHGIVYLYNSCDKEKSYETTQTGLIGWNDEFVVNKPLGVHRAHYAGDESTFVCDDIDTECRFDYICLKIMESESWTDKQKEKYTPPICTKLGGDDFEITDDGSITC